LQGPPGKDAIDAVGTISSRPQLEYVDAKTVRVVCHKLPEGCPVRFGSQVVSFAVPQPFTISAGSGRAYFALEPAGIASVTALPGLTIADASPGLRGMVISSAEGFRPGVIPIGWIDSVNGQWQSASLTDWWPSASMDAPKIGAGLVYDALTNMISLETAYVDAICKAAVKAP
jgi:hypothetical protein